jgi:hypothetical protein
MEISKHPEMGNIVGAIRKIADDMPCDGCKALKDDLNAAKSRMTHWKDKYDELKKNISEFVDEFNRNESVNVTDSLRDFFEKVSKTIEEL